MQPYQQRVVYEKQELDERAKKLSQFIGNDLTFETLPAIEQQLLKEQCEIMWQYSEILGKRIEIFIKGEDAALEKSVSLSDIKVDDVFRWSGIIYRATAVDERGVDVATSQGRTAWFSKGKETKVVLLNSGEKETKEDTAKVSLSEIKEGQRFKTQYGLDYTAVQVSGDSLCGKDDKGNLALFSRTVSLDVYVIKEKELRSFKIEELPRLLGKKVRPKNKLSICMTMNVYKDEVYLGACGWVRSQKLLEEWDIVEIDDQGKITSAQPCGVLE